MNMYGGRAGRPTLKPGKWKDRDALSHQLHTHLNSCKQMREMSTSLKIQEVNEKEGRLLPPGKA